MRVRRVPVIDELTVDGRTVVLVGGQALLLSADASARLARLPFTGWAEVPADEEHVGLAEAGLLEVEDA